MSTTKHTFCRICEPACPLQAELDNSGEVIALRPDPGHPLGGIPCNKGVNFLDVHRDSDRLNWPLKRKNPKSQQNAEFERIDWDNAIIEVAQKIKEIQKEFGNDAVAIYGGNPIAFDSRSMTVVNQFAAAVTGNMFFGAGTQDCTNKFVTATAMYGCNVTFIPDLPHTDYLLCIGANPKISHWTFVGVPNDGGKILKDIKSRGGKVAFVNPRKIESSTDVTGETLLIKPDTDVYFLAALSNEIYRCGGFDDINLRLHGKNVDHYLRFIQRWTPDKVADVTGISAEDIRQVAKDMMAANSAACYLSTGVNQGRQGTLSYWLSEMLNFATGNLGRQGGTYKAEQLGAPLPEQPVQHEWQSPYGKIPIGASKIPGVLLSDLIERGNIRAVICLSGNPALSVGGGEQQLTKAFSKLDMLVCVDISPNLTSEYADYILPAADWLERADISGFTLFTGTQLVPHVHYSDAIVAPKHERRTDWWILSRLMQALDVPSPLDDVDHREGFKTLDAMLATQELSIEKVKSQPWMTSLLEQQRKDALYETCLLHEDGKIDCYPASFSQHGLFDRVDKIWSELVDEPDNLLKLISMRTLHMHNSWMANVPAMRSGNLAENRLRMCLADAESRGLMDGEHVKVFNENGELECRIEIRDDLRTGAVAMSHGYGHKKASRLSLASQKPGQNCNRLMPVGAETYEPLSHMSWMCGVPVNVERLT